MQANVRRVRAAFSKTVTLFYIVQAILVLKLHSKQKKLLSASTQKTVNEQLTFFALLGNRLWTKNCFWIVMPEGTSVGALYWTVITIGQVSILRRVCWTMSQLIGVGSRVYHYCRCWIIDYRPSGSLHDGKRVQMLRVTH